MISYSLSYEGSRTINNSYRRQTMERDAKDSETYHDFSLNTPRLERNPMGYTGENVPNQKYAEGISLPEDLGDLLVQWTTLDDMEIRRGQLAFAE